MFARFCSPASLLLAVMVSLSPVLSCYAYADQSNQGQEVAYGSEDYRGTGRADEPGDGGAQPQDGAEAGAGAAGGEAQKADFLEAASSGLSALGGSPLLGVDGASAHADLHRSGRGGDSGSDGLGAGDGQSVNRSGDDSSGLGELSESGFSADEFGDSASGDNDNSLQVLPQDEEVSNDDLIEPRVIPAVPASIYAALSWIGVASTTAGYVDQFVGWFSGGDKNEKANIAVNAANFGMLKVIANILHDELDSIHTYTYQTQQALSRYGVVGSAINKLVDYNVNEYYDGYTYSTAKYLAFIFRELEQAETLSKQQWGYGYGGTAVFNTNSPAGWLQKLKEYNVNEYYDGYTYSTAKYLAFIFRELERGNSKLNYSGSLVGGDSGDYSAARLLARVHNALYGDITYAETGNGGVRSAVSVLGYIANLIYYGNNDIMMIAGRNLYNGGLNGVEGSGLYSTARLLARLYNANVQEVTLHETGSTGYRSTAGLLGYLANLVFDTQYSDGQLIETGTSAKRSLADLLRYTANLAYLSKEKLNQISSFMQADSSLLSKSVSDILSRLDLLHEDMGAGISVDTSGIESNLDKIAGLLLAAGVIENGKDLFDAVFGDLSGIGQAAATGAIQSAMEDAFPFCVPALVKQVFGLLVFEGSAPVWEFDICGHPLVCDFSGFQLVADCTSWLARLGFVLALLVNTRKFVFTVNGGGSS